MPSGALKGHVVTPETRAKLSAVATGRRHTAEARAKMSVATRGRKLSLEHRAKLSVAAMGNTKNLGRRATPEARAALSKAMRGNTNGKGNAVPVGSTSGSDGGYRKVKTEDGTVREHRAVMEGALGRELHHEPHPNGRCVGGCECVHHVNGERADNRIENLDAMTKSGHHRLHAAKRRTEGLQE